MLYTSVTEPQVEIVIDEIQAACANVNCDYKYVTGTAEVTSQSFSTSDLLITIGGTSLPTTDISVVFGGAPCGTVTSDGTSATCTLQWAPYGGDHDVELYDANGLVSTSGLTSITVDFTVTSVSPDTDINRNGGDELTIAGTGFPVVTTYITVEFTDGTLCSVTSATPTQILCTIDGLDTATLDVNTPMDFTITLNTPDVGQRRRNLKTMVLPPGFPV